MRRVRLKEIGTFYSGLSGKSKSDFSEGNALLVTYRNIFNNPVLNPAIKDTVVVGKDEKQNEVLWGDILITGSSETPADAGMSSVVLFNPQEKMYLNSFCFGFRLNDMNEALPSYIGHLLRSTSIRAAISKTAFGVTRFNVNRMRFADIDIPLPPLNIQKEIVSILDSFTSLIDKMKQEAEMRKKQMDYYREKLFSFGKGECEWRTLNELFTFKNGINKEKNDFGRGTPIINYVDVYSKRGLVKEDIKGLVNSNASEQSRYKCKRGDVFFTRTSETKEEVGFPSVLLEDIENCVFSGFVLKATPTTDLLDTHYCKYCFFTYQFRKEVIKSATYTTRALTNGTSLSKISIPVPSLEKQRQIASILDTFETYISKLEQMIELRQKQYEYYREKLLTFE